MRKKALLAAMMALVLLLSSCALVVKDEAVDNATEIIRMGDQVITKDKVKEQVELALYNASYNYSLYGYSYDTTDPDNIAAAQESAVNALKKDLALTAKATELGLDKLTDEELEEVKKTAQENYDSDLSYIKNFMLENTEGKEDEELTKEAEARMTELGYNIETYTESATKAKVDEKLKDYAIKDVAVTDEEIQADYDSKVEADKTTYGEDAASWATAANNKTTLYYTPAGVRRVKQILTKFKDEDQSAIDEAKQKLTDANTARTSASTKVDAANETLALEGDTDEIKEAKEQAQKDLSAAQEELEAADKAIMEANEAVTAATDKAFENLDADVDAILASLDEEGADWQKIMDEKNQDPGMTGNEKGYAVATGMNNFDSAFVEAAMALAKPGDHSGKVKGSSYGYYIIRYEGDETEGPVALDDVKETISSALLKTKQDEAYNAAVEQWVEEAGITVDMNALKD